MKFWGILLSEEGGAWRKDGARGGTVSGDWSGDGAGRENRGWVKLALGWMRGWA